MGMARQVTREHSTRMAMDDDGGCKQEAGPRSPQSMTTTIVSRLRALLPHVAAGLVLALAAAHLARAREPRDVAFVVAAHAALALLVLCLGRHEAAAPTAEARRRLRVWVWVLSTALTGLFASRVAPAMPPPLDLVVYGLAALVTAGGFVLLFVCNAATDGAGHVREKSQQVNISAHNGL